MSQAMNQVSRIALAKQIRQTKEKKEEEKRPLEKPLSESVLHTYREQYVERVKAILKVADELYQGNLLPERYLDPTRILNFGAYFTPGGGVFDEEESYDYRHLHSVAIFVSNGMEKGIPIHGNKSGFDSDWHINDAAAEEWMRKFDKFEKQFYRWFDRKYGYTPGKETRD